MNNKWIIGVVFVSVLCLSAAFAEGAEQTNTSNKSMGAIQPEAVGNTYMDQDQYNPQNDENNQHHYNGMLNRNSHQYRHAGMNRNFRQMDILRQERFRNGGMRSHMRISR